MTAMRGSLTGNAPVWPMALLNRVCREQLFPRRAYRRAFAVLLASDSEKQARRTMVGLLALAHDRACEAELRHRPRQRTRCRQTARPRHLDCRFAPKATAIPDVTVEPAPLHLYDELSTAQWGGAA